MNRIGLERLFQLEEIIRWSAQCIRELLNEPNKLTGSMTWSKLCDNLIQTERFAVRPKCIEEHRIDRRWLDPVTVYIVLANEHVLEDVRIQYRKRAKKIDSFQSACVEFLLYEKVSDSIQELFQTEIREIGRKLHVAPYVEQLPEMTKELWSDEFKRFMLTHSLGPWGRRNNFVDKDVVPRAIRWREEWLTGWVLNSMVKWSLDSKYPAVFKMLHDSFPSLMETVKVGVQGDMRGFRRLMLGERKDRALSSLYLLRFGNERMARLAWKHIRDFLEQYCRRVTSAQHTEIIVSLLMNGEPVLIPRFTHPVPIASVIRMAKNGQEDIFRKRAEQAEEPGKVTLKDGRDVFDTIGEYDSHTLDNAYSDFDWKEAFEMHLNIKHRMAYVLWHLEKCHPIDIPEHWFQEFADMTVQTNRPVLSRQEVAELCSQIMASEKIIVADELKKLFAVRDVDTVRNYSGKARSIMETQYGA